MICKKRENSRTLKHYDEQELSSKTTKLASVCVCVYKNINVYSYVIKHHNQIQRDISKDFQEN